MSTPSTATTKPSRFTPNADGSPTVADVEDFGWPAVERSIAMTEMRRLTR